MGNENCFELPGVDCIYFIANVFYAMFFFTHYPRNQPEISEKQYYSFIPRINLLNLRYFVAEVRWVFPVNRQ